MHTSNGSYISGVRSHDEHGNGAYISGQYTLGAYTAVPTPKFGVPAHCSQFCVALYYYCKVLHSILFTEQCLFPRGYDTPGV